jgi:glycerol uptake facilitator-like aquaporin
MDLSRRLVAETVGTAFLLAAIVGSGIMAQRLAGGNVALALLCNSLATGAMLTVLIAVLCPVSGAHFNPAVTLAFLVKRSITKGAAAAYVACQIVGGILGTWTAHLMFGEAIFQVSTTVRARNRRSGSRNWWRPLVSFSPSSARFVGRPRRYHSPSASTLFRPIGLPRPQVSRTRP